MRVRVWQITIALLMATVVSAARASATSLTFNIDQSGTGPVGLAGTVVIDDALAGEGPNTVDLLVKLNDDYGFVSTGAGDALAFNLLGDPAISIIDITSGFAIGPTSVNEPPFGTFNYAVTCTVPTGCGHGGSNPNPGPLTFDVVLSGITVDSFIANDAGFYFASDLMGPNAQGTFVTGNMGAIGPGTPGVPTPPPSVPEPASLTLLGTGLVLAARKLRRNRAA